MRETIYGQYKERLKPGTRTTGHELEFPVYDTGTCMQPSLGQMSGLLLRISGLEGSRPQHETLRVNGMPTREYCTSVVRMDGKFQEETTTDMAIGTMELGIKPEASLRENEERLKRRFDVVLNAASLEGLGILGLGTQPFQPRSFGNMMPKERYAYLVGRLGDDLLDMTVTSAAQLHIDVSSSNAIRVLNAMLGFAPAIIALTANSTIVEGSINPNQEFRGIAWDSLASRGIIEKDRIGIPARFCNMDQWYERMSNLTMIFVRRGDEYLHFPAPSGLSFAQFANDGEATAQKVVNGERTCVRPELKDFLYVLGTTWHDARLTGYGTVELRAPPFQPSISDLMAINALALGISLNSLEAELYLSRYTDAQLGESRADAIRNGTAAHMGQTPILKIAADMLGIASRGLQEGDLKYLLPLRKRLEEGTNHAMESRRRFAQLRRIHAGDETAFMHAFVEAHRFSIS